MKQVQGLTILYVGNGKGKTTAAVGLAVRARGWKQRVFFLQFVKEEKWPSGERAVLKKLGVDLWVLGEGFVKILNDKKPFSVHKAAAARALKASLSAVRSNDYDVVILDEAVSAVESKLLPQSAIIELIKAKRPGLHLVLTGHAAYPKIVKLCDLVTEMKKLKHPYDGGRLAEKGLDF
jgi:cob(I)alamin adenosyltransferase